MVDLDENKRDLLSLKDRISNLEATIGTENELSEKLNELEAKTLVERILEWPKGFECCFKGD